MIGITKKIYHTVVPGERRISPLATLKERSWKPLQLRAMGRLWPLQCLRPDTKRVLIVDAEQAPSRLLRDALIAEGYEIAQTVSPAAEAIVLAIPGS